MTFAGAGSTRETGPSRIADASLLVNRCGTSLDARHVKISVEDVFGHVGVSREELLRALRKIRWTEAESRKLKRAMDTASEVFGQVARTVNHAAVPFARPDSF